MNIGMLMGCLHQGLQHTLHHSHKDHCNIHLCDEDLVNGNYIIISHDLTFKFCASCSSKSWWTVTCKVIWIVADASSSLSAWATTTSSAANHTRVWTCAGIASHRRVCANTPSFTRWLIQCTFIYIRCTVSPSVSIITYTASTVLIRHAILTAKSGITEGSATRKNPVRDFKSLAF